MGHAPFCGETCLDPSKFKIYHLFEKNLTAATGGPPNTTHPCSLQLTAADTHYTVYNSTVTHGVPGLLAVTLDLYGPGKTRAAEAEAARVDGSPHTFTAIPGRLTSGCGHAGSPLPYGCDVAPKQDVTLASAESICGALEDCVGISFQSPTATPAGVVQGVYFKGADVDCGYSRFAPDVCPSDIAGWQTYLKDYTPVPRPPVWLRHYNLSVVPPRCGDINIEPLFPFDIDDGFNLRLRPGHDRRVQQLRARERRMRQGRAVR